MTVPVCPECGVNLDAVERRHASVYRHLCRTCWDRWAARWGTAPEIGPGWQTRPDDEGPSSPAAPLRLGFIPCICGDRFIWDDRRTETDRGENEPHMHCPACGRMWRRQGYLRKEPMERVKE